MKPTTTTPSSSSIVTPVASDVAESKRKRKEQNSANLSSERVGGSWGSEPKKARLDENVKNQGGDAGSSYLHSLETEIVRLRKANEELNQEIAQLIMALGVVNRTRSL